jgi:hypothetical protein
VDDGVHQQALRIDKDMALFAFDFLPRVATARIDAAPPFSALFTLWRNSEAVLNAAHGFQAAVCLLDHRKLIHTKSMLVGRLCVS